MIPTEAPAEQFLATASPAAVKLWQQLPEHLTAVAQTAAIASQFGCRTARFPLIVEYSLAENRLIDDRALLCADGNSIAIDSAPFMRPDAGHRDSPWFKVPLKLHSITSAQERYRVFASAAWEQLNSGPAQQWLGEDGELHRQPRPVNPYAQPQPVS